MSALGMASLGTQCADKALGMASLGVFCDGVIEPEIPDRPVAYPGGGGPIDPPPAPDYPAEEPEYRLPADDIDRETRKRLEQEDDELLAIIIAAIQSGVIK